MKTIRNALAFTLLGALAAPAASADTLISATSVTPTTRPTTVSIGPIVFDPANGDPDMPTDQTTKKYDSADDAYTSDGIFVHENRKDEFGPSYFQGNYVANFVLWAYKAGTAAAPKDTIVADAWAELGATIFSKKVPNALSAWARAYTNNTTQSVEAGVYAMGKTIKSWKKTTSLPLDWSLPVPLFDQTKTFVEVLDVKATAAGELGIDSNISVGKNTMTFSTTPYAKVKVSASGSVDAYVASGGASGQIDPLAQVSTPASVTLSWIRSGGSSTLGWSLNWDLVLSALKGKLTYWYQYLDEDRKDEVLFDKPGYSKTFPLIDDLGGSRTF